MQKFGITITWVFGIIISLPFLLLGFAIAQDNLARFVQSQDCRNKSKIDLTDKTWQQENIQFSAKNLKINEIYAVHTSPGAYTLFRTLSSSYSCEVKISFDLNTQIKMVSGELTESVDILSYLVNQGKPNIDFNEVINLEKNKFDEYKFDDLQKSLESKKSYTTLKWKSSEFEKYVLLFREYGVRQQNKFLNTNNFDYQSPIYVYNKITKKWSTLKLSKKENQQILENYLDQKIGKEKQKTIVQIGFGKDETLIFMVLEDEQTLNKKAGDEVEVSGIAIGFAEKDGKIILLPE